MEPLALHAETVPDDPKALRWVLPDGLLQAGRVVAAPGPLGRMLSPGGLIVRALAERGALWTWLADADWPEHGPAVRDAIILAALQPDAWQIEAADDEVLRLVARDVIDRGLAAYIASHGGRITLVDVADGEVEVALNGACEHCPAAGFTLHGRIEKAIRERVGDQVVVRASAQTGERPVLTGWWPKLLRK